jgi:hypothetical protein
MNCGLNPDRDKKMFFSKPTELVLQLTHHPIQLKLWSLALAVK